MSMGGRARERDRFLRRAGLIGAVFGVVALLFLLGGHWIVAIVLGAIAAAAIWAFMQARSVR